VKRPKRPDNSRRKSSIVRNEEDQLGGQVLKASGKWNRGIVEQACELIKTGSLVDASFICLGVSRETFERWIENYPKVGKMIEQAQAQFIACSLQKISQGKPEAGHLRWLLERIAPSEFARPSVEARKDSGGNEQ